MTAESLAEVLGAMVVLAGLFAWAAWWMRIPTIVGYLLAGALISPLASLAGDVEDSVDLVSKAGIVLLLFLVGLELDLSRLRELGIRAILVALWQMALTFLLGLLLTLALGLGWMASLILAAALTFSSTVAVVKVLTERKEAGRLHGKISIAVLLLQDFAIIILLALMAGIDPQAPFSLQGLAQDMARVLGGMVLLLGATLLAGRRLLDPLFSWAAARPRALFLWSLCWCFLLVQAGHLFGLTHEIGAFLAGVSLSRLPFSHELCRRVNPLMHFFIAIFFIAMGLQIDLDLELRQWLAVGLLSLSALAGKFLIVLWAVRSMRFGSTAAFRSAALLCQISEFSLILVALAKDKEMAGDGEVAIVGLVGLLSMSCSALLVQRQEDLCRWLRRRPSWRRLIPDLPARTGPSASSLEGHVIVVGMNSLGRGIARRLVQQGQEVLAIDTIPRRLARQECRTLLGDATDRSVLEEARLSQARLLVSALHIEDVNSFLAWQCQALEVPCAIHAVEFTETSLLMDLDIAYLMLPKVDGVKLQNRKLQEMGILGE